MSYLDTVFNWLPKLRAPNASLLEAQCDANGALKVAIASSAGVVTTWVDPAPGTQLTYKRALAGVPKKLHLLLAENTGASTRWLMLFDSTTTPANGAAPTVSLPVLAGQGVAFTLPRPRAFSTGIYYGVSSTAGTYTEDVAALFRVHAEVE